MSEAQSAVGQRNRGGLRLRLQPDLRALEIAAIGRSGCPNVCRFRGAQIDPLRCLEPNRVLNQITVQEFGEGVRDNTGRVSCLRRSARIFSIQFFKEERALDRVGCQYERFALCRQVKVPQHASLLVIEEANDVAVQSRVARGRFSQADRNSTPSLMGSDLAVPQTESILQTQPVDAALIPELERE